MVFLHVFYVFKDVCLAKIEVSSGKRANVFPD